MPVQQPAAFKEGDRIVGTSDDEYNITKKGNGYGIVLGAALKNGEIDVEWRGIGGEVGTHRVKQQYFVKDAAEPPTQPAAPARRPRTQGKLQRILRLSEELASEAALSEERIREIIAEEVVKVPPIQVRLADGTLRTVKGHTHPKFPKVLRAAQTIKNVLLVGKAGTGKTYLARQIADAIGARQFGTLSVSPNMSESWLLGRYMPDMNGGRYIPSDFIDIYEQGGVFVLDDLGAAGAADVMMVINQALANGRCPVPVRPERPVAIRHPDCIIIGATNVLTGADNIYSSQAGMEGSTRDRFVCAVYHIDYDTAFERGLVALGKFPRTGRYLWKVRKAIDEGHLQQVLSSRTFEHLARLKLADDSLDDDPDALLEELEFWTGWTAEEKAQAQDHIKGQGKTA